MGRPPIFDGDGGDCTSYVLVREKGGLLDSRERAPGSGRGRLNQGMGEYMAVRVYRIASYAQVDAIRDFVRDALRMDPEIAVLLAGEDPKRLVVVKPNWIQESHEYSPDVWEPVITHPVVLTTVIRCVAEMMGGRGTICICDAPHTYANFAAITARGDLRAALDAIRGEWPELKLELIDLRREVWIRKEEVVVERRPNTEDPRGYARLNLGRGSFFFGHPGEGHFFGADYDRAVVNEHHHDDIHEYLIAGSPIACDLFINLPKLKTHKKTGITCCLKNLVGINGDKNWLPHHTEGTPQHHGDEFPGESFAVVIEQRFKRLGLKLALGVPFLGTWLFRKMRNAGKRMLGDSATVIRNGNWSGNDTCWRMALDLNRCLLHGENDGSWRDGGHPKRYLAIVDGITGGEGNGPLCPDFVASGVLIAGTNPAETDAVAARLMGFDPADIPIVRNAFGAHRWPIAAGSLEDVRVVDGDGPEVSLRELAPAVPSGFKPHFGWTSLNPGA